MAVRAGSREAANSNLLSNGGPMLAEGEHGFPQARRTSRLVKGPLQQTKPPNTDGQGVLGILLHPVNFLLVCFPFGILAPLLHWGDVPTFWLNFVALIPLAKILGDATEELAAGLRNDMLAGLLNATFGNAVEMVIMVQTLRQGYVEVVKATLLGSVLSNLLLVLGMSFFFGGIVQQKKRKRARLAVPDMAVKSLLEPGETQEQREREREREHDAQSKSSVASMPGAGELEFAGEVVQTYSAMSALVNASMLLLSCLSFSVVTVFAAEIYKDENTRLTEDAMVPVSRICSIIVMCAYIAYIFFQLVTHKEAMAEDGDEDGADEEPTLSIPVAILLMVATTFLVAFSSEFLVASLEGVVENSKIGQHFIGIILLPIVGNACEHASAIRFAIMDKPGLSIGIAVGSSTQIALFVVPFSVICSWFIGASMDLNFGSLNVTVMLFAVLVVLTIVVDGSANWLQGYLLISAYLIIAMLYWHIPSRAEI